MKISQIFFVLIFLANCDSEKIDDVIEECLLKILKNFFPNQPLLLITDLTLNSTNHSRSLLPNLEKEYQRRIIKEIMSKKKSTLQIYNSDKFVGLPSRMKLDKIENCFFFIRAEIIISKELFQREMDRLHQNPLWNPIGRTLAVVIGRKGAKSENLARKVADKFWTKSKSVNNVVMVADGAGGVNFYTWFPYRQPDCSKVKNMTLLDSYQKGNFLRNVDLFPQKVQSDLQGCRLVAATETCIPYVFADENNANKFIGGLEINIMNALSDVLNFSLTTMRPANMWTTSVNKSLVGAFKLLAQQRIDLAFSCLMLNQERHLLAPALPPYYLDYLVWFVPSPTFKSHVTEIFQAFSPSLWLVMICIMSLATVIVAVHVYWEGGSVSGSVVKMIGVSVVAPVGFPTQKTTFRLFIFGFFLYSMHITIAFQSSLFALYQKPHYKRFYTSLRQAADDGLFVYLRSSSKELYNQSDHDVWNKILRPGRYGYLKDFGDAFSEIAYNKSAVALFIRTTGIYMISVYFTDEYGVPQILWLKNKFAPYPVTSYMSPGHPLFPIFTRRIYNLLGSGLMKIWLRRAVLGGRISFEKSRYHNKPLTLKHVGGAFFLMLFLLSFAVLAFIVEVLLFCVLKRIRERKKPQHRHFPPVKTKFLNSKSVTIVKVEGYQNRKKGINNSKF